MSDISIDTAWLDARKAWECGFTIVAQTLNLFLTKFRLKIECLHYSNDRKTTLKSCRHNLLDALRRTNSPMPEEGFCPWTVGYINSKTNDVRRIGGLIFDSPDEELQGVSELLRMRDWGREEFKELILEPVEENALKWRSLFEESSRVDVALNMFLPEELEILRIVQKAKTTLKNDEIHAERETKSDIKTTKKTIKKLVGDEFLVRPNGNRKGVALTDKARLHLK